jgi:hypothetical protein
MNFAGILQNFFSTPEMLLIEKPMHTALVVLYQLTYFQMSIQLFSSFIASFHHFHSFLSGLSDFEGG